MIIRMNTLLHNCLLEIRGTRVAMPLWQSVNRITFGIIAEGRTLSHLFAERFLAGGKTVPANARREWWGVTGLYRGTAGPRYKPVTTYCEGWVAASDSWI